MATVEIEGVRELKRKLEKLEKSFDKKAKRKILRPAAHMMKKEAEANTPISQAPHKRYRKGSLIATYYPGNLKRSINVLSFRKTDALHIGPKIKKDARGDHTGRKVDGYYARFVEFGTSKQPAQGFMRKAFDTKKAAARQMIIAAIRKRIADVSSKGVA